MAVMHESGHAMYEAGLPENWDGQPVGQARSMSIHESQSLLIEMQVCRSREFINYIFPQVKETLGLESNWNAEALYNLCTRVQPSLIRVNADEVTYPAHIILRYYLEKYLLSGDMGVEDLPEAWKQGMEKFVGIAPDNDTNGCLQDIHWMDGTFAYFPTYVLGAVYAAQIFSAAKNANSEIVPAIAEGNLAPIKKWLNEHIHDKACRYETEELIESATGKKLDLDAYKNYLKAKYLEQ